MNQTTLALGTLCAAGALFAPHASALDLAVNGGFETGDVSDWVSFPTPNSTFEATSDANTGSFGGFILNEDQTSSAVIKQANLGAGLIAPGDTIEVSFFAKGEFGIGGVAFAEFFSEIDGGGVSKSEIFTGAPLALTDTYQPFTFTTTAGSDVSGGVTLQFAVVNGAVEGSFANFTVDDVTINIEGSDFFEADFNQDGAVNLLDLDILGANWQSMGATNATGDANADGNVDLLDLDILGAQWQQGETSFAAALSASAVPEPASLSLLALTSVALVGRRRKA